MREVEVMKRFRSIAVAGLAVLVAAIYIYYQLCRLLPKQIKPHHRR